MTRVRRLLSLFAIACITGCGGSATGPAHFIPQPSPTASAQATPASQQQVAVTFTIVVPTPAPSTARSPKYVSPSTKSATITVTPSGGVAGTPVVTNCTSVCTASVYAIIGSDTFLVNLYDGTNGNGNLLSTGSVTQTIVANEANNVNVAFGGVITSIAVSGVPSGSANLAFTTPESFVVTAKDADGNVIIGTYSTPIVLTDSDALGATLLATSGSDSPPSGSLLSSSDTATLLYNGLAITPATLTATGNGVHGSATFAPTLAPIVMSFANNAGLPINFQGVGSPFSVSFSEAGYTNAPYSLTFSSALSSGCALTASPSSGATAFTVTAAAVTVSPQSCSLTISDTVGQQLVVPFNYFVTTSTGLFTVPAGVSTLTVTLGGAAGGSAPAVNVGGAGGSGGTTTAVLAATAGAALDIEIGGLGAGSGTGGYNGGGAGSLDGTVNGGGGGGATDVRAGGAVAPYPLGDRIIIAGGGGGGGGNCGGAGGGGGSSTLTGTAQNGTTGCNPTPPGQGNGGSNSAGGTGGVYSGCTSAAGQSGNLGLGGNGGGSSGSDFGGGGGGGGYYGGGAGADSNASCSADASVAYAGGGGGGSSYVEPSATFAKTTQGSNASAGFAIISW